MSEGFIAQSIANSDALMARSSILSASFTISGGGSNFSGGNGTATCKAMDVDLTNALIASIALPSITVSGSTSGPTKTETVSFYLYWSITNGNSTLKGPSGSMVSVTKGATATLTLPAYTAQFTPESSSITVNCMVYWSGSNKDGYEDSMEGGSFTASASSTINPTLKIVTL